MELKNTIVNNFINYLGPSNTAAEIRGAIKKQGITYQAAVYLYSPSENIMRSTVSDQNGFYVFKGLAKNVEYIIFSRDKNRNFNAVVQDNVVPK